MTSSPPFIPPPPLPITPLRESRPGLPVHWQAFLRQSSNRSSIGNPIFSASRQRLSPDIGLELNIDLSHSPWILDNAGMLTLGGNALELILPDEHQENDDAPNSPQSPTNYDHPIHIVESEYEPPESPTEYARSMIVLEGHERRGDPDLLLVEREEREILSQVTGNIPPA
jgi:hypothetical protein